MMTRMIAPNRGRAGSWSTAPACVFFVGLALLFSMVGAIGLDQRSALAAPEPNPTPPRWQLEFEIVHELRLIRVRGDLYWFMTYLVTNKTGEDQTFVPEATLYTDAGEIIRDGNIDYTITNAILDRLRNPLLESKTEIIGPLLQGKENAREGLFVWKAGSLDIDHVSVFISGLASETQVAVNPYTGDESIVRKTLALEYDVPGSPLRDLADPVVFSRERWIMR